MFDSYFVWDPIHSLKFSRACFDHCISIHGFIESVNLAGGWWKEDRAKARFLDGAWRECIVPRSFSLIKASFLSLISISKDLAYRKNFWMLINLLFRIHESTQMKHRKIYLLDWFLLFSTLKVLSVSLRLELLSLDLIAISTITRFSKFSELFVFHNTEETDHRSSIIHWNIFCFHCKQRYATLCIRENPGCLFIATNRDAVTHLTDAQEWAGFSLLC